MAGTMEAMQRTIDALTQRLAGLQNGGGAYKTRESEDMPVMHHKDVDKPSKFSWQHFASWSIDFMNLFIWKNTKWKISSQVLQNVSQKLFEEKGYEHFKNATKIQKDEVLKVYEEQLYEYLKTYTARDVHTVVISSNPANAFESWRRICDQRNSIREIPLRDER